MKVVYIAHPLRGATKAETERNRYKASKLVARLSVEHDIAPVCSWIVLAEHWSEEEGRARGLEIDKKLIERCDELWITGPNKPLTEGIQIEVDHAIACGVRVIDLRGVAQYEGIVYFEQYEDVLRRYALAVLDECQQNISKAARSLGVDRRTIYRWAKVAGVRLEPGGALARKAIT